MNIEVGIIVKDKITGFEGVVDHIGYYPHQCANVGVRSRSLNKDGEIANVQFFDEQQLEIISSDKVVGPAETPSMKYQYGQKVKCSITGYEGKVNGWSVYLNGCSRVLVQPEHSVKKEEFDSGMWFPENQVEVVGKLLKEEKAPVKTGGPTPGGRSSTPSSAW